MESMARARIARDRWPAAAFAAFAAAFVVAAAVVAVVHAATPITRGWWLVAYLSLVGGVAQLLLGTGLAALAERLGARGPAGGASYTQLALWNVGTVVVAVADLEDSATGVLAGSILLVVALASFALGLRRANTTARRPARGWVAGYLVLVVFLAGSVAMGAVLAEALPGR
jgi:hypothetical protein